MPSSLALCFGPKGASASGLAAFPYAEGWGGCQRDCAINGVKITHPDIFLQKVVNFSNLRDDLAFSPWSSRASEDARDFISAVSSARLDTSGLCGQLQ